MTANALIINILAVISHSSFLFSLYILCCKSIFSKKRKQDYAHSFCGAFTKKIVPLHPKTYIIH